MQKKILNINKPLQDDRPDFLGISSFASTSHTSYKSVSNPASSESTSSIQVLNKIEKFIVDNMCQVYLDIHSIGNSENKVNCNYHLLISCLSVMAHYLLFLKIFEYVYCVIGAMHDNR